MCIVSYLQTFFNIFVKVFRKATHCHLLAIIRLPTIICLLVAVWSSARWACNHCGPRYNYTTGYCTLAWCGINLVNQCQPLARHKDRVGIGKAAIQKPDRGMLVKDIKDMLVHREKKNQHLVSPRGISRLGAGQISGYDRHHLDQPATSMDKCWIFPILGRKQPIWKITACTFGEHVHPTLI